MPHKVDDRPRIRKQPGYIDPRIIDIRGQRFGAWTVVGVPFRNQNRQTTWPCRCDCGVYRDVVGQALRGGKTSSCGCQMGEKISEAKTVHGQSANVYRRDPADVSAQAAINKRQMGIVPKRTFAGRTAYKQSLTYKRWMSMKARVKNPRSDVFKYYGGRGITVCERWAASFENFLADMGECPEGMTLDRYPNGAGNYEPGNCRWANDEEQAANRRQPDLSLRQRDEKGRLI